ncbi:MAG TPA: hypothetical protein VMG58_18010, partial [Candidatus Sulfotelmatobacter sp.]|nr:hypothetical protein [Candidatus Sulfotelmatobacter sp.]
EETGLLVPPRRAPAIAEALTRLAGDAALRRSMGEKGRLRAIERFDWSTLTDQLVAAFEGR